MAKTALRLVAPTSVNGTVHNQPPRRRPNSETRQREFLTEAEVETLIEAARDNRWGQRDATAILMAFRHGLRVSELCALTWDQVHLSEGRLDVRRRKNGRDSTHYLSGRELRALRKLQRDQPADSRHVFLSERGGPLSEAGFRKMLATLGVEADLPFPVHPHMLRHACGYKLANDGQDTRALQDYLGHKNIQHTVRYTELSADRFKSFWPDC